MKISVIAHTNAKQSKTEPDKDGVFHIFVKEPPLDGRANQAIIEALADFFEIKKNQVYLEKGAKSKNKVFTVIGV